MALEMAAHEVRERYAATDEASRLEQGLDDAEEIIVHYDGLPGGRGEP